MRVTWMAVLAVLALGMLGAATASANTLTYSGAITGADPDIPVIPFDKNGATTCGTPADQGVVSFPGAAQFHAYAFRNESATSDCISVASVTDCSGGAKGTYDVTAQIPAGQILGSDVFEDVCQSTGGPHQHSFTAPAGQTFVEAVLGFFGASGPYALSVSGSDLVPVRAVSVTGATLPNNNTLNVSASSHEDGTSVLGTLEATAGPQSYSGAVRCLRVSGDNASLVMTISSSTGLASKWKGVVYWLHQSVDGTTDAQRNSLLDQSQLNGKYAACPDPDSPLSPGFKTLVNSNENILVVENGPQTPAP